MKVLLNIGTAYNGKQALPFTWICDGLNLYSFKTTRAVLFESDTEPTWFIEAEYRGDNLRAAVYALADDLHQDAIAYMDDDGGHIVGPSAWKWLPFNPEYFTIFAVKEL